MAEGADTTNHWKEITGLIAIIAAGAYKIFKRLRGAVAEEQENKSQKRIDAIEDSQDLVQHRIRSLQEEQEENNRLYRLVEEEIRRMQAELSRLAMQSESDRRRMDQGEIDRAELRRLINTRFDRLTEHFQDLKKQFMDALTEGE